MLTIFFLSALLGTCSIYGLNDVPKCCGDYEWLDVKNRRCQFAEHNAYNVTTDGDNQIYRPANSFPLRCPNGLATFNVTSDALVSDSVTVADGKRTLSIGEMCIVNSSSNVTTIAYCKAINKCCPPGQVLHSSLRKCAPAQGALTYDRITRDDGTSLSFAHDSSGHEYYVKFCASQLLETNYGIEFDSYNGTVIRESFFNQTRNSNYYCLDSAVQSSKNEYKMVAMVANPNRPLNDFTNFRKIFPHFCFASSGFLLLTIAYYCAMPKLRRNLHGYSMMCFLLCMMIVQIDIGLSFFLSDRTCICTFIPYHRNFFRYASSAWTTVMGYITWSQLKNAKNQSTKKKNKKLAFALYSLYAWGLSLVLVAAGIAYDYLHPLTSICWWGTWHVKMFMDIPNIILQLLNNIFFIPSMMHVCKSIQFMKESDSMDANELKNKRRRAVIKMFAMMQSTKLAEILFSIRSLFDIKSGVYLMCVMCLYATIGPVMFGALVDVKAFFATDIGEKLRDGFQSTFHSSTTVVSQFRATENPSLDPSSSANNGPPVPSVRYMKKQSGNAPATSAA